MGGFFGIGQSGGEKASTAGINNIFNYALPTAQSGESSGASSLSSASDFFKKMLAPGRTVATANAAPATNAAVDQSDATRRQEASQGTYRGGGTASANREAGASTNKNVDDIINANLVGGQKTAAEGLTQTGAAQTSNAAQLLGLGQSGQENLYSGSVNKEDSTTGAFSKIISAFI